MLLPSTALSDCRQRRYFSQETFWLQVEKIVQSGKYFLASQFNYQKSKRCGSTHVTLAPGGCWEFSHQPVSPNLWAPRAREGHCFQNRMDVHPRSKPKAVLWALRMCTYVHYVCTHRHSKKEFLCWILWSWRVSGTDEECHCLCYFPAPWGAVSI